MKTRYIKQLFSAALTTVLSLGVTSCINDLDTVSYTHLTLPTTPYV